MSNQTAMINGSQSNSYDRKTDLKAFDEGKTGVKGLVDVGVRQIPSIFVRPHEDLAKEFDTCQEDLAIPIVDLAHARQCSSHGEEIIRRVIWASDKWGFFQVVNHGVPLEILDEVIEGVRMFHEQDVDAKKEFYTRDRSRQVRFNCNRDLYESTAANWRDTLCVNPVFGSELDPELLPPICREVILGFVNHVIRLGDLLLELLSVGLGLEPNHLREMDCTKTWSLVGHYYPACPEPDLTLGTSKHSDPSFLTILLQDQIGGLQVLHQNQWVNVKPVPGALIVNIGDILQIVSNDKLQSVYHRVIPKKVGPRISVATFLTGPISSPKMYGAIKELVSEENPPIYKEFTLQEFFEQFFTRPLDQPDYNFPLIVAAYVIMSFLATSNGTRVWSTTDDSSFNVLDYGAIGDGIFQSMGQSMWSYRALLVPGDKTFLLKPISFKGPCKSKSIHFQALSLHRCNGLRLMGLKHKDSPNAHIRISGCDNSIISNLHINAPEDSPNTDGIDISSSTHLEIHNSIIATGDDCIAIGSPASWINITRITCGPGHGISVGSLGRGGDKAQVEEIHVRNCTFKNSKNGARIKTWQGGSGYARKITFDDIPLVDVENPIIIDQYYCDRRKGGRECEVQPNAVAISDVTYNGFQGTSATLAAITLNCSQGQPCANVVLQNIKITSSGGNRLKSVCENVQGSQKERTMIYGSHFNAYDRNIDLKAFDESKTGVKGLVDAEAEKIPSIFVRSQEDLSKEFDSCQEDLAIPIIDLTHVRQRDSQGEEIIRGIIWASEKWGFFQLVNHGIPLEVLDKVIEGVRMFHEQDVDVKKEYYSRDHTNQVLFTSNRDFYHSKAANWRDTLEVILAYMNHVIKLGDLLLELLSVGLGLEPDHLGEMCRRKDWSLNLTLGTSKHSDSSFLTILLQDQIGGLQVLHQNQWVNVKPVPDALIVNTGDLLQVSSTIVIAKKVGPRISIAAFLMGPVSSTKMYGPIKKLVSKENPPIYKVFTRQEFLEQFFTRPLDPPITQYFQQTMHFPKHGPKYVELPDINLHSSYLEIRHSYQSPISFKGPCKSESIHFQDYYFPLFIVAYVTTSFLPTSNGARVWSRTDDSSFNVLDYGAIGDGKKDDTEAFSKAWAAVCGTSGDNPTLLVPGDKTFLLKPVSFTGVDNLVLDGQGELDGRGSIWWGNVSAVAHDLHAIEINALSLYRCNGLQLKGLTHKDSPRAHIRISSCDNSIISNLNINAPEDSPNTDGIDISSLTQLQIHDSVIATGDDCIAIGSPASWISITGITCGPGHGISVGSLGRGGEKAQVEEIDVRNCTFKNSQNGARIKTWQVQYFITPFKTPLQKNKEKDTSLGGHGYARNITFDDIRLIDVENPIIIDQYYCDGRKGGSECEIQPTAVAISDVTYNGFQGTSATSAAITLNCSQAQHCTNIVLQNIEITSSGGGPLKSVCENVEGSQKSVAPSVTCFQKEMFSTHMRRI
ncbi:hypothetical protein Cgig2_027568 [Carnegiea gigantea]|uniref:Fe2OG dioxygenase domain-containing protein n=1 Tax=Carnegiea gigantea TaxID=171969 RepID=A0A9Q1JVS5_9CARY|nr:hypothetical protein Cgig2_027568 [Carnegiea gigantea]